MLGVVDVVVLTLFLGDALEVCLTHDLENSICCLHQGWVEVLFKSTTFLAETAVFLIMFIEFYINFDSVDGPFPSSLPVIGDV